MQSKRSQPAGKRRFDLHAEDPASSELARDINRDIVLELLRRRQPIARVDLARLSGLQRSTVSLIVEQLLRERWIVEGATVRTARGRRPTMLSLNADLVMLVADVRPSHAVCAVVDLNGHFLARQSVPVASDAEIGVQRIAETLGRMRDEFARKSFEGVGISMPGRVHPESQQLLWAPNLRWHDYDIRAVLADRLGLKVEMDNAANACMLSELWFGRMEKYRNAVLVTISEGVGAAVLANGQLLLGKDGMAGEFGHILIDPNGPQCNCGERGCWEMFASTRAVLRRYNERAPEQPAITFTHLMSFADQGDPRALAALEEQAQWIARGLRMITAALSPETILFAGDITACWERSGPVVQRELAARMLMGTPPALIPIGDGEMARLRGAAALVLQRHSNYHRSTTTAQRAGSRDMVAQA
ncbi:ROK family protein [Terriglobus sp.]|uniref:ROK family protein n=1 Tax=Terriglobus sp. TaxID=1889013 RepID=UPI003AFFCB30